MINCEDCGGKIIIKKTPNLIHYAKKTCSECGKWYGWVSNPNRENRRTGTSKYEVEQVIEFHKFKEPLCFFCLRTKDQLGVSETLTRDHIIELDKGGKDEIENIQILCSACHKLKNWARLYMNWHIHGAENEDC